MYIEDKKKKKKVDDSQLQMTGWDCMWPLHRTTVKSRALFGFRQNSKGIPHSIYLFFPSEASWNGRQSEGLILLLTRPQGIVLSVADSFQCHSVSSDPHSSNGVLRETALSQLLFHTLSFLTPPANPALFHWMHSETEMKTIPFCPMSHYPPQLIYKKILVNLLRFLKIATFMTWHQSLKVTQQQLSPHIAKASAISIVFVGGCFFKYRHFGSVDCRK